MAFRPRILSMAGTKRTTGASEGPLTYLMTSRTVVGVAVVT